MSKMYGVRLSDKNKMDKTILDHIESQGDDFSFSDFSRVAMYTYIQMLSEFQDFVKHESPERNQTEPVFNKGQQNDDAGALFDGAF